MGPTVAVTARRPIWFNVDEPFGDSFLELGQ